MIDYYQKYLKYKIKYITLSKKNENKIFNYLHKNQMEAILNLDFLHDNPRPLVKGNDYYDMINGKKITISNDSYPQEIEYILHKYFIDLANNEKSIYEDKYELVKSKINIKDLNEYTAVFDISTDNNEMKKKLKNNLILENKNYQKKINTFNKEFIKIINQNEEITKKYFSKITTSISTCKICYMNKVDFCLNPCGHLFCNDCLELLNLNECSLCRKKIINKIKIYNLEETNSTNETTLSNDINNVDNIDNYNRTDMGFYY